MRNCKQGHPMTPENTMKPKVGRTHGRCRECNRQGARERRVQRAAATGRELRPSLNLTTAPDGRLYDVGRFWEQVDKSGDCWVWTGPIATCRRSGRSGSAHRIAYTLSVGLIPEGMENERTTHCKNGHEFTSENTYYYPKQRACKTCHRENAARQRERARLQTRPIGADGWQRWSPPVEVHEVPEVL